MVYQFQLCKSAEKQKLDQEKTKMQRFTNDNIEVVSSSLQHLSLLVHRTLNSPASDIGRIRNSPSSCWEELSTVAFRASNLSQFYTKEELESRHRWI